MTVTMIATRDDAHGACTQGQGWQQGLAVTLYTFLKPQPCCLEELLCHPWHYCNYL